MLTTLAINIVKDALAILSADLINSQRTKKLIASGKSARSVNQVVTATGATITGQIRGVGYFRFQELGRGPGKGKRPSRALVDAIKEWVKVKGINIPPYAIAMKIHRDGIKVPNRFNPGKVLSDPLSEKNVRAVLMPRLQKHYLNTVAQIILN